jgi:hypothetical protein
MRTIFISYEMTLSGFHPEVREEQFYCSGPIIAFNEFHRQMQLSKEIGPDRKKILRPKLAPGEYKILRAYHKYSDSSGKTVCSDFDLPDTSNPRLEEDRSQKRAAKKADKDPANFFGFYEEVRGEKPEDNSLPAQA